MNLPLPDHFHAALAADRLSIIGDMLIAEHFSTATDLQSEFDDGYSRGCTRFARQKNRLRSVALSGEYDWLQLLHAGNDLVFSIGGIPCRFTTDDPSNPTKPAVLSVTPVQQSFFDAVDGDDEPCKFCFILDGGYEEAEDPRVVFLGEDIRGQVRCQWISNATKALHIVAANTPPAKDVGRAPVGPKRADSDSDTAANSEE
ncbi:hypothetical protein Tamer19_47430 [Cupriavidus sp. TA19]|uniref:hypothetical protein n=1 Tax=unclassified Cupriavidus TaxID=2640874 RepID=UPI000E2FE874|nr:MULTISPECIES: hypothetical protein [unclassified Cupriavidus]BDB30632.1 hypothetical protein CTP10_R80490 [Cupriavidus sp. P-10]GLC95334.1 hypothetical protein Tamer19_47430 [Cupriavidus sp. TA19]